VIGGMGKSFVEGPIGASFLSQFNRPHHEQRFNGHPPGTDPEDQYSWWYEHPQSAANTESGSTTSR
jgi:hypothetical protein